MTIKREFCGQTVTIELTEAEELNIYFAVQLKYLQEDFEQYLTGINDYQDIPANILRGMAKELQEYLGDGYEKETAMEQITVKYKVLLSDYKREV